MPFGIDGKPAKANDPATWSGYWPVVKRFQVGGFAGIGYEFSADDPFVGVDLDGCRNPETCEIADWAKEIITGLDTYAEVSPSRTGVKLFLRGKSPLSSGKKKLLSDVPKVSGKTPAIEMYDHGRYFTVTGHRLPGPREPQERQAQLDALVKRFWPSVDAQNGQHRAESSQYRTAVPIIRRARKYVATMEPAISGHDGHGCAYAVACALCIGFNLTREDALSLMREYNERCVPPWSERELEHKVDDALAADDERGHLLVNDRSHKQNGHVTTQHHIGGRNGKVAGVLTSDGRTDVSNAKRLIEVHGADLRWCDDWGCWLVWTAGRWAADQQRVIDAKAKDVAGRHWEYLSEFSRDLEPAERAALVKFATASSSARGIRNMVALARSEPGVAVMPEHLDCRSWLLNTLDGTVDLRTGIPQAHSRANLLTKQCSVGFDASATCPTWEGFLATIMAGNSELIQFLQRSLGYSLTGDTSEQVLFFLHGGGSNGKTTLLSTVQ